jgi:hypothetical protein
MKTKTPKTSEAVVVVVVILAGLGSWSVKKQDGRRGEGVRSSVWIDSRESLEQRGLVNYRSNRHDLS